MTAFPAAVGKAMAVQVNRTRHEPTLQDKYEALLVELAQVERERDTAQAEVKRLNEENDILAVKAHRARKPTADASANGSESTTIKIHEGVEYVNQSEAATILNVGQYAISRWVKAGKFQMIAVPGYKRLQIVRSSLHKPAPGKAGRKKK